MYKIINIYLSVYRLTIMAGPHRYIMYFAVLISFMNALTDGLLTFGLIGLASSFFDANILPEVFTKFIHYSGIQNIKSNIESGIWIGVFLFLLLILKTILTFLSSYIMIIAKNRVLSHIRTTVIRKALLVDFQKFSYIKPGTLEEMVSSEGKLVTNAFVNFISSLNIVFYALSLYVLIYLIDPLLTLIIIPFILFFLPFKYFYSRMIRKISSLAISFNFKLMGKLNQILSTIKEIKINNTIYQNMKAIEHKASENANKNILFQSLVALEPVLIQVFSLTIFASIFYIASEFNYQSEAAFLAILFIFYRTAPSISKASKSFNQFISSLPATERVFTIYSMNTVENLQVSDQSIDIHSIEYKDISFGYNDENLILKNIDLEFLKGEISFISGNSGSGKSSIFNLLVSLYKPKSGEILINKKSIEHYPLDQVINSISITSQNMSLPKISILNILRISNKDLNIENAYKILDIVELKNTIKDLPEGINTILGQKGIDLSGGQLQRVAIASSIASDKSCYIFDEATSELDEYLETKIYKNLQIFLKNKMLIFTNHRSSNLPNFNKSYLLKDGTIEINK